MGNRYSISCFAVLVLAGICVARSDELRSPDKKWNPGVWHEGRYIGYRAGYESLRTAEDQHAKSRDEVAHDSNTIVPANFVEPNSEELLPPPLPVRAAADHSTTNGVESSNETVCCGNPCWWGRAEYLLWWSQGMNVPALATSGDAADPLPGALGQPGTQILFGDGAFNDAARSGGRFTIGKWLDPCQSCGIEATYLALGDANTTFNASSNDFAVLARPFFDTVTGAQDSRLIANPGEVAGTLDATVTTGFRSLEVLYRRACMKSCSSSVDWLIGYRYSELKDRVRVDTATLSLAGPTTGTTIVLFDEFDSRNSFNGVEFGLVMQQQIDPCWSWEASAKVALGGTNYQTNVAGQTTTTDNVGNVSTAQGGLLALGTNSGSFLGDDFATVSEFGVVLRRELQCGLTAMFGYNFVYWGNVARAGEQIDTTINSSQIPPGTLVGEARPEFPFQTTDFWAQGLRFGIEYNF